MGGTEYHQAESEGRGISLIESNCRFETVLTCEGSIA